MTDQTGGTPPQDAPKPDAARPEVPSGYRPGVNAPSDWTEWLPEDLNSRQESYLKYRDAAGNPVKPPDTPLATG